MSCKMFDKQGNLSHDQSRRHGNTKLGHLDVVGRQCGYKQFCVIFWSANDFDK